MSGSVSFGGGGAGMVVVALRFPSYSLPAFADVFGVGCPIIKGWFVLSAVGVVGSRMDSFCGSGGGVCCNGGSVDGWCGGVGVCVGGGAGGGGLVMVDVDVGGVVAEALVVVVSVDGGGMLCVVLVLFLSGV